MHNWSSLPWRLRVPKSTLASMLGHVWKFLVLVVLDRSIPGYPNHQTVSFCSSEFGSFRTERQCVKTCLRLIGSSSCAKSKHMHWTIEHRWYHTAIYTHVYENVKKAVTSKDCSRRIWSSKSGSGGNSGSLLCRYRWSRCCKSCCLPATQWFAAQHCIAIEICLTVVTEKVLCIAFLMHRLNRDFSWHLLFPYNY